jgi:hypothetical protein
MRRTCQQEGKFTGSPLHLFTSSGNCGSMVKVWPVLKLDVFNSRKVLCVVCDQDIVVFNGRNADEQIKFIVKRNARFSQPGFFFGITHHRINDRNNCKPSKKTSIRCWPANGSSLFSAPKRNSNNVTSETPQVSLRMNAIYLARMNCPAGKTHKYLCPTNRSSKAEVFIAKLPGASYFCDDLFG